MPDTVHLEVGEVITISGDATVAEILDGGTQPAGRYRFDVYFDVYVRTGKLWGTRKGRNPGCRERGVTVLLDADTLDISLSGSG